ncbi:hypothetical protein D8674_031232 [Pyrus ussuriensis x Pyrus communis]|uniref:C2 domain-containing protein n=1 Tax=Pyrus ussuriensis x Pyrus communis TaxID=2448454 RepID=A0A5N5F3D9_9ROSA|nr:hypothetical protein D8674_031232 [Pyrus ussuriensis x Pyrus communis]
MMKEENGDDDRVHVLEINLVSAQGLMAPSVTLRRMQTYALAWVDSAHKIRSRVDKVGGENPTWNDRCLFKVPSGFLSSETSQVSVQIYAVGCFRDHLVGTVRFLINNFLDVSSTIPSFTAIQIRRPSGRFRGVLNVAALVIDGSSLAPAVSELPAIGYRDLMGMGESFRRRRRDSMTSRSKNYSSDSKENSCTESTENSDLSESAASSPETPLPPLKELNTISELAGKRNQVLKAPPTDGSRFLCCFLTQRKIKYNPSDQNADGAHSRERY